MTKQNTNWLTLSDFYWLCHFYEKYLPSGPATAADFSLRYPGKLEACLAAPQQTFGGRLLYPKLPDQAAILFYLLIKNHPFENGNKRLGLLGLLAFLAINRQKLTTPAEPLHQLVLKTAASTDKNAAIREITDFLKQHLTC